MSPIGGVGVNLAVQDAIATANILAPPLRARTLTQTDLVRVQKRREWPARATQRMQIAIQNNAIAPTLGADKPLKPPFVFKLFRHFPILRRIPARLVGIGVRPEHVAPVV